MHLTLRRFDKGKNAVSGILFFDGIFFCFTMENREKCIAPGTYQLILSHSPKFTPKYGHKMVEVVTPGTDRMGERDQILFHIGNKYSDSLGCVLVGDVFSTEQTQDNYILESKTAYERFWPRVSKEIEDGTVLFTVSDPPFQVPLVGPTGTTFDKPVSVA